MKKTYMVPLTEMTVIDIKEQLLTVSNDQGLGYGGVDEDGTMNPSGRDDAMDILTGNWSNPLFPL